MRTHYEIMRDIEDRERVLSALGYIGLDKLPEQDEDVLEMFDTIKVLLATRNEADHEQLMQMETMEASA